MTLPVDPVPPDVQPKSWFASKTLWLGVLLTIVGISTYFADPIHTPAMTLASISEAVGGVAAVILRVWFTYQPISGTSAAAKAARAWAIMHLEPH